MSHTPWPRRRLAFSTQAAYAAPLILLAQNRQDSRDRAQQEQDREVSASTEAETADFARLSVQPPPDQR